MKKRISSMLLAIVMVWSLFPAVTPHVHGEEHICVDHDFNHHCDDVGCRQYIDCYDSEIDDDDHCDLCGACLTPVDEDEDNACDICGYCMAHTFEEGYWYNEGGYHYPECDYCSYYNYAQGAACSDGDDDACCDVCGNCVDGEHSFAWDGETRDTVDHRIICSICGEEGWENHSDSEDEDSLCDVCDSCIDGYHGEEVWDGTDRNETTHRIVCEICGATYGWMDHTDTDSDGSCDVCLTCMNDSHSYHVWEEESRDVDMHRLVCSNCGLDSGWESHLDEDNDGSCDTCGYEAHVHTYENGAYHMDSEYHYAICDTCGHWDGLNCGPHTYENSSCICDVCAYSLHQFDVLEDLEDGTHQGVCTACGETLTQDHVFDQTDWDAEGHWYVCACGKAETGAEKTAHVYEANNWYWDNRMHYPECDGCGYHQPEGEAHILTGGSEVCGECSTCRHTVHSYAWNGIKWDEVDHWSVCSICGEEGWENHFDGDDADERCDACGYNMGCQHEIIETEYDGASHWKACLDCGQMTSNDNSAPHSFDSGYYHWETDKHYPECDGCYYYAEEQGAAHTDTDGDARCDVCDYDIHEHTYEYEYWAQDNEMHYPVCDWCDEEDRTKGEACTDTDNDHICDVCYGYMDWLCGDNDNDHNCDVCNYQMPELCVDNNNDHDCDVQACQRYMWELCSAALEGDWSCDTCSRNFCNHYFENMPLPNGDGTHTALCIYCGYVIEDCFAWHYDYNGTTHTAFCSCGYEFPAEEHTYLWVSRSVAGHLLVCDGCFHEKAWEVHSTQNGVCAVCEMQVTPYDDVYLGGVGLKDGQYLDNDGIISATKPEGGYAYYEDGVLELNGYVYAGSGFLWREYDSGEPDWAALYATKDLTLVLKGENSLQITQPDAAEDALNYSDGITAEKNLTIRGDGSLTIAVNDDGVQVDPGDVIIEGGILTIKADDHGFDVNGSITVTGGTVNVTAGDEGFNVCDDVTISGGEVNIDAADIGVDSYNGNVIISGGTVDVTAKDNDGIWASEDVTISGGNITIDAAYIGIFAYEEVVISDGDLVISSEEESAIYAYFGNMTISGGNLQLTAGNGVVLDTNGGAIRLPEGVELPSGDTLTIETPFLVDVKDGALHLTNSPWNLKTILIASYDSSGKLAQIQLAEEPGAVVGITVQGEAIEAFFLNDGGAPIRATVPVQ